MPAGSADALPACALGAVPQQADSPCARRASVTVVLHGCEDEVVAVMKSPMSLRGCPWCGSVRLVHAEKPREHLSGVVTCWVVCDHGHRYLAAWRRRLPVSRRQDAALKRARRMREAAAVMADVQRRLLAEGRVDGPEWEVADAATRRLPVLAVHIERGEP